MERAEWLKEIQHKAEALYDHVAPQYWVTFGIDENITHRVYLQQFLERVAPGGTILSAACGAGRYDGFCWPLAMLWSALINRRGC